MITALLLIAAFAAGVLVGALWQAPVGKETRDGLVLDVADHQADQGAKFADELSKGLR